MSVIEAVAERLMRVKFEDLPVATIERQKDLIIDTLGVAVAGAAAPAVKPTVDLLREMGGRPEASVLVVGEKLPACHAALANSLMAHALDFDDMHERAGVHANVCVLPAALAAAERVGRISGRSFLTAVVLGVDLVCRLGVWVPLSRGWHATATLGIFGATAVVSRLLGLDVRGLANALGIAYCQAAGNRQGRLEGALTKRLQPALAAKAAVWSSLLARAGLTGPKEILEGDWGMLGLYTEALEPERVRQIAAGLVDGLGETFLGDELSIKPYPCCKATHTSIDAVLKILEEEGLQENDIEEVEVFVSNGCYQTVGRPFEVRTDPQVDAQFSIPYTVATAIQRGQVGLEDFEESVIMEIRRQSLAKRVKVSIDPDLSEPSSNVVNLASRVVIKAKGGTYSSQAQVAKGHPARPMDRDEVVAKFQSCLNFGGAIDPARQDRVLGAVLNLEMIDDVGIIPGLLCGD